MKYSSKSLTNVGKVRSANEDNLGESKTPNGNLFVVCDGMGGHVGGAQASTIAVNSIIEYFQRELYDNAIQAIDHALLFANEQIYASALSNPELKGMGTTAVVLLVQGDECFIGHVGDSRIYLRSNGKLNRITKDHSFVQTLVDSGIIADEDAENHPYKNQILQALGIASSVKGSICQVPILPKASDMFLLCSDGLNGMVKDLDIEKIMQEDNLIVTSENLITAALNGGGTDNVTATLVLIEESMNSTSRFVHFNPKPKVSHLTSTQQISTLKVENNKISKVTYFIVAGIVLLGACLAAMFFSVKETKIEGEKLLTKSEIEDYLCTNKSDLIINLKVGFKNDTVTNEKCDVEHHIYIVQDSLIIKDSLVLVKNKQTIKTVKEKVNEVKAEISKEKIKEKKEDTTKKDESNSKTEEIRTLKIHTVHKGESLQAIVDKYRSLCPKLSEEKIKDHNVNAVKFKGDKAKLEEGKLMKGMVLEIHCE